MGLCRMKQVIKQEFDRKLSEMTFTWTKLIELFNRDVLASAFEMGVGSDGKSITVKMNDPEKFEPHAKELYATAQAMEVLNPGENAAANLGKDYASYAAPMT